MQSPLKKTRPTWEPCLLTDIAKTVCILSIQYLQKRKTGDKKNETRKASSFRRKGTLSRGLVVAGKAYLKKEKKKAHYPGHVRVKRKF